MANNELRNQMQTEAVCSVFENHRVIVEWGTGVGKSRVAIRTISALFYAGRRRVLMLVAESAHKSNWRAEFCDCLGDQIGEDLYGSITVECYASLPKYEGTKWDLIVADEAHHLRSDNRMGILASLRADYMLCLSATMSDSKDADELLDLMRNTFGEFKRLKFTMDDAIQNDILAKPNIYVHVMELDALTEPVTVEVAWGWPNARKEISCGYERYQDIMRNINCYPNAALSVTCSAKQGYQILTYHHELWKKRYLAIEKSLSECLLDSEERASAERQMPFTKNLMLRYALLRKQMLGTCKTGYARKLLQYLEKKDRKYVCFCATVEQGEKLNAQNIINAKRNDNARVIDAFNRNDIRSLFAVGMIQEGSNLAGIQSGVIIQLDGKERPFIQKFGRTMRSECPEQHILLVDGTQDVKYFNNAVDGIDPQYIKYINTRTGKRENIILNAPASETRTPVTADSRGFIG